MQALEKLTCYEVNPSARSMEAMSAFENLCTVEASILPSDAAWLKWFGAVPNLGRLKLEFDEYWAAGELQQLQLPALTALTGLDISMHFAGANLRLSLDDLPSLEWLEVAASGESRLDLLSGRPSTRLRLLEL